MRDSVHFSPLPRKSSRENFQNYAYELRSSRSDSNFGDGVRIEFTVLGSLALEHGENDYLPAAPEQRQVLALLLLNVGRYVSINTCAEELWDYHRPKTAVPAIQTYILQIRKSLASVPSVGTLKNAHGILSTGRSGYRLALPERALDLTVFNRLLAEGRSAAREGRHADAAATFQTALAMRRGPMLDCIQPGQGPGKVVG